MHTLVARTVQAFPVLRPPPRRLINRLSCIMATYPYRTLWTPYRYPHTRRSDHVDVYKSESRGEIRVRDPFQWLEYSTQETEDWTSQQDAFTRDYLDQNPDRQKLEDEIRANSDFAKFSAPTLKDDARWYWYYNSGLQAQSVIYRSVNDELPDMSGEEGPGGEVFFDPNLLSDDGTAALAVTAFCPNGLYFAYGISRSGSDFYTIYIRPTSEPLAENEEHRVSHDKHRLPDEVRFVKFSSVAWTRDSEGFFYQRYPERTSHGSASEDIAGTETDSDKNAMLFYHRVKTSQSEDILIHKDENNPEWFFAAEVSDEDGQYLIVSISRDTSRKNLLWIADMKKSPIGRGMTWDKVVDEFEASYSFVANDGAKFYFITNKDAPNYKLVTIDISKPAESRIFEDILPEDAEASLEDVTAIDKDKFVVVYKRDVKDEIYLHSMDGQRLNRVAPDYVGAATVMGRRFQPWFFASLTGFTNPGIVAQYDFRKPEGSRWGVYRTTFLRGLKAEDFDSRQVWYISDDGTRVPMFIIWHKDTKFDGTAPAIQYGYGGFGISIEPFFSASILTVLQRYGAILAVPNIRGGGEFGDNWHLSATRENKVKSFEDFIAAAQFLADHKYAAAGKITINGGSNGGFLVAACVNRAPEGLLGAAVAEVGVLDLLKFADFTIGRAWTSDYGDPHDPHDFDFIYPISPLHNVPSDKILPPTLLLTADHDDRVVPLHSFKHAATLQYTLPHNPHPLLIRIEKKAGHGAGKSTDQRIREAADKWGFVVQSLGLQVKHDSGIVNGGQ